MPAMQHIGLTASSAQCMDQTQDSRSAMLRECAGAIRALRVIFHK